MYHYNPRCVHKLLPTAHLRICCATSNYDAALQEIARLNNQKLMVTERLIVNVYEVLVKLTLDQATYAQAQVRLVNLAQDKLGQTNEDFRAAFYAQWLNIAGLNGDHSRVDYLTNHFFDSLSRTPVTESYWRLAQGANAQHRRGPASAILFYQTVLFLLKAEHTCLRESAARRLAFCANEMGDTESALSTLLKIGLPVSLEPRTGELAFADLLVQPTII